MLELARLQELLRYDPGTGHFTWLVTRKRGIAGAIAGCINKSGYRVIRLDGTLYLAHRLAWLYQTGSWPSAETDHVNGLRSDNRWCNLREATRSENMQNVGMSSRNTIGYTGVAYHAGRTKPYAAQIRHKNRTRTIGYFDTPEAAGIAYLAAKADTHTFQPTPRQ